MDNCKDCDCNMKSISNNLFNKNILCKKNSNNFRFLIPFEFVFYITSFSIFTYYNYHKFKKSNILIKNI